MENTEWTKMSPEEKKIRLYLNQKELLDTFLSRRAITQAQYEKSLKELTLKMGIDPEKI
ncbi:MAG: hypothetical protein MJ102_05070 [Clostridia bacterium]|nr:hypothetical protein [Clostridia bacterium]